MELAAGSGPWTVVRPLGESLDLAADCDANQLVDGEVVYLVERVEAPAPPAVSDVTDMVAGLREGLAGEWGERSRRAVGAALTGAGCLAGGFFAPWGDVSLPAQAGVLGLLAALLTGLAALSGRAGKTWQCVAACAAAAGLSVPLGVAVTRAAGVGESAQAAGLLAWTLVWAVAGVGAGGGLRHVPAAAGGGLCGGVGALGAVLFFAGLRADEVWGVVGMASVAALGLVPAWAMSASGLTGLDDFAAAGERVGRRLVADSLDAAYRTVSWCVAGLAVLSGLSAVMLALAGGRWAVAMAVLLVAVTALRARAFPAAAQVSVSWLAAAAGLAVLLSGLEPRWRFAGYGLVVAGALAATVVRVPDHVRIRARGWGNAAEKLGTAATLPVLLGLFGVYDYLLGAF
jgi:hypothetical protein